MVTIHDKGSDNVRLRSGSCHVMTKKTSISVPMCKEKRMKNGGESNFRYTDTLESPQVRSLPFPHPFSSLHCLTPLFLLLLSRFTTCLSLVLFFTTASSHSSLIGNKLLALMWLRRLGSRSLEAFIFRQGKFIAPRSVFALALRSPASYLQLRTRISTSLSSLALA